MLVHSVIKHPSKKMNFNFGDESPDVQEALAYVMPFGKFKHKKTLGQLASGITCDSWRPPMSMRSSRC
jgi:hypothetical protein